MELKIIFKKIGVLFVLFYHDERRVTSHLHGGISLAHLQKRGFNQQETHCQPTPWVWPVPYACLHIATADSPILLRSACSLLNGSSTKQI